MTVDVSLLKTEFAAAINIGSRDLVEAIGKALEHSGAASVCDILVSDPIFAQRDVVIYSDLLFLLGRRDLAMQEYAKWLVLTPLARGEPSDLLPFARTCHYANELLRARISKIAQDELPEDMIGRFVTRSASASLGDWPSCMTCHTDDLLQNARERFPAVALRMIALSVLAYYNMVLYKDALKISLLLDENLNFSIIDARFQNLNAVIAFSRQRSDDFDRIMRTCAAREAVAVDLNRSDALPAIDFERIDIFIKTYPGDEAWLEWCLKSIKKFARGFRRVVIVSDIGHNFKDTVLQNSTYIEIPEAPLTAPFGVTPGYLTQQITKLNWHRYTDADAVMMLDSDTILRRAVSPQDMVHSGRPVWYYGAWDLHGGQKWRPGSEIVIGRSVPFSYMREHPFFLSRRATECFHGHVERRFGKGIADIYFDDDIPAVISEFECFGAFLACVDNCDYLLEEITAPRGFVIQHWSWGGLDEDTRRRLEMLLEENMDNVRPLENETMQYKNMSVEERSQLDPLGEMELFRAAELWDGGYIDSDPLDPVGWSSYSTAGFVSVYHAAYLACIKPYVHSSTVAMEIGPGRGAWTKAILSRGADRVYALDVQSRETNVIDEVLGELSSKLEYIVVTDFSGEGVPDESIDFFWSFGTFVHLSRGQQRAYYETIARKMKSGAIGFTQYADIPTWNRVVTNPAYHIHNVLSDRLVPDEADQMRSLLASSPIIAPRETVEDHIENYEVPDPGRYFYVGTDWVVDTLMSVGLEVFDRSVFESLRDPVIGFRKP